MAERPTEQNLGSGAGPRGLLAVAGESSPAAGNRSAPVIPPLDGDAERRRSSHNRDVMVVNSVVQVENGESQQREVMFSTESAVLPQLTQTRDFAENEEVMFLNELSITTKQHSDCKLWVELPLDVSPPPPVEETVEPSKSAKAQKPMEETASHESSTSVPVSTPSHSLPLEDKDKILLGIEELKQNFERLESDLKEEKSDRQREVSEVTLKLNKLEKKNGETRSIVISLQKKLDITEQQLKEALNKVERLRQNNSHLTNEINIDRARFNEERTRFREETEQLQTRVVIAEREKSEAQESSEKQATLLQDLKRKLREIDKQSEEKTQLREEIEQLQRRVASAERERSEAQESAEKQAEEQATLLQNLREKYETELRERDAELLHLKRVNSQNGVDGNCDALLQSQGSKVGLWTWIEKLGSGGFGDVFLAEDVGSPGRFAVKQMALLESDGIEKQEEMMLAFIREMKVLQECKHSRVVKYIDKDVIKVNSDLYFYIKMEYMAQGSLSSLIKKGSELKEPHTKFYTKQLLEGLQYLHTKGIIHCDIKCSNILLDESGNVKLADFGCAKFKNSKETRMFGTIWWMAPELVNGKRQYDGASEKSDVWSVGATVIEMLTGETPFNSDYEHPHTLLYLLGNMDIPLDKFIHGEGFSIEAQEFLGYCLKWVPSERADVNMLLETEFVRSSPGVPYYP